MRKPILALTLFLVVSLVPAVATATDYFLSAAGNDANTGTSAESPWRTLARVNAIVMQPGDRVLLRGGDTFDGFLYFDEADAGSATSPITVTSYGTGRATVRPAGEDNGILVYNTAGYRITNVNVAGTGGWASGILVFTDLPGSVKLSWIRIESVAVSGFGRDGVEIGSWNGATGYRDVRLTSVTAHNNKRTGIITYAQQPNVHENVYVGHSRAHDNPGISEVLTTSSGNGIVLGGVNGAMIERSAAYGNGALCVSQHGPVGIWTYDSTGVIIQHNESYNNRTGGGADGGGFDLDQNVSNSILQYNYAHGNDGAGYLLGHPHTTSTHSNNVVRYNISENDGRRNSYGAIEVWGRTVGAEIYNNTVFLGPAASGTPSAVRIWNDGTAGGVSAGLHLSNNILQTAGGIPLATVSAAHAAGGGVHFRGNAYHASGSAFTIVWGSTPYNTLDAWRTTGQETLAGSPTGISANPLLTAPGSGGTVGNADQLENLNAYRLQSGSPAINAALNLGPFGVHMGSRDFRGSAIPQAGAFDIGAVEQAAAAPVAITSFSHNGSNPLTVNTPVQFTTTASGGSAALQYQYWLFSEVSGWSVLQAYTSTATATWTPAQPGTYALQVWVRSAGVTEPYEAWQGTGYITVAGAAPAAVQQLTTDKAFPARVGQAITFTAVASGGTAPLQYRFWRYDPGAGWIIAQEYSATASYTWTPGAGDIGQHALQVWVRSAGSSAAYEAWRGTGFFDVVGNALSTPSLTADVVFPVPASTPVQWTVQVTGGSEPLQYQFWVFRQGSGWTMARDYTTSNTFAWTPAAGGEYAVQAWVRNAGSTSALDAWTGSGMFSVAANGPARIVSFTASRALPAPVGATIAWSAVATGGTAGPLQFQFWLYNQAAGTWTIVQPYGSGKTFTWSTSGLAPGTYALQVWVRSAGSTAAYEGWAGTGFFALQ